MLDNRDVLKIAKGDLNAFGALYGELSPELFYYVYKIVPDDAVCKDVVQEAFILYWKNRKDFSRLMPVKVYLFTVVKNLLRNHSRTEAHRKKLLAEMQPETPDSPEDYLLITAEASALILRAVDELPPQTARIIKLSMENYSVPMIAEELNISQNTIKSLKKAGYKALRDKLGYLRLLLPFLILS